jgi:hypothetical protein
MIGLHYDISKWVRELQTQTKLELYYSVFHQFRKAKFGNLAFDFKLETIFATALAASKNEARVKRGQNWLENNQLANNDLNPWNSL